MASQVGSYYGPAAAYGSLSAASMASMAAAAAAQQNAMSGLTTPAQVCFMSKNSKFQDSSCINFVFPWIINTTKAHSPVS